MSLPGICSKNKKYYVDEQLIKFEDNYYTIKGVSKNKKYLDIILMLCKSDDIETAHKCTTNKFTRDEILNINKIREYSPEIAYILESMNFTTDFSMKFDHDCHSIEYNVKTMKVEYYDYYGGVQMS